MGTEWGVGTEMGHDETSRVQAVLWVVVTNHLICDNLPFFNFLLQFTFKHLFHLPKLKIMEKADN